MDEKELESILNEAYEQGANADQLRELHARLTSAPEAKTPSMTADILKSYPLGLVGGAAKLASIPFDLGKSAGGFLQKKLEQQIDPESLRGKALLKMFGPEGLIPEPKKSITEYIEDLENYIYQPQTTAGKFAKSAGEWTAPMGTLAKGTTAVQKGLESLKSGGIAGVGAEALGELTEGTPYEQPARLVGAIATPVAASRLGSGAVDIARGMGARGAEDLSRLQETIYKAPSEIYKKIDEIGAGFEPKALKNLFSDISEKIKNSPMVPEYNKYAVSLIKQMGDLASRGELTLGKLDQYRRMFRDAPATIGEKGVTPKIIQKSIDSWLDNLKSTDFTNKSREAVSLLYKGRGEFKKASQIDEMAELIKNTGGDPRKIKKAFSQYIVDNPDLSQHAPEVQKAIREAAKTGAGEWLMNVFGKAGIDFGAPTYMGSFLPSAVGVGGGVGGSFALPAAVAGGTLSKYGGKYMARGRAEDVLRKMQETPAQIKQLPAEEVEEIKFLLGQ